MTAWEQLIQNSTISSGDAWEHLLAQGGGSVSYLVLSDGLEAMMETTEIEAEIGSSIDVDIDQSGIEAQIDQSPLEIEI